MNLPRYGQRVWLKKDEDNPRQRATVISPNEEIQEKPGAIMVQIDTAELEFGDDGLREGPVSMIEGYENYFEK